MTFPEKLTELLEKATKGPWDTLPEECDKPYIRIRGTVLGGRYKIANIPTPVYDGAHEREAKETRANAELIVYLVNHAEAIRDLVVAAEKAKEAMMVWTNTYAPEMCDPERVKKSRELLNECGTLYYIATVSQSLSEALAKLDEA